MKKAFIILTFLFASFGNTIYAQPGLSMNDSSIFLASNDTLLQGGQIVYGADVFNNSSQIYSGYIIYYVGIDSSGTQGATISFIDSSTTFGNIIAANDTIFHQDTIPVSAEFKNGINTVVIWPVAEASTGFVTLDSAKFNIFIVDPLRIQSTENIDQLVLYPNPFSDKIWLITRGDAILEEVRIVDALGKLVFIDKTPNKQFIETVHLQQGVYFIELTYTNGAKKRIKTMKQ